MNFAPLAATPMAAHQFRIIPFEILTYVRHEVTLMVAHLSRTIRSGATSFILLVVMLMGVPQSLTTQFAAQMFVLRAGIQAELRQCHGTD